MSAGISFYRSALDIEVTSMQVEKARMQIFLGAKLPWRTAQWQLEPDFIYRSDMEHKRRSQMNGETFRTTPLPWE